MIVFIEVNWINGKKVHKDKLYVKPMDTFLLLSFQQIVPTNKIEKLC